MGLRWALPVCVSLIAATAVAGLCGNDVPEPRRRAIDAARAVFESNERWFASNRFPEDKSLRDAWFREREQRFLDLGRAFAATEIGDWDLTRDRKVFDEGLSWSIELASEERRWTDALRACRSALARLPDSDPAAIWMRRREVTNLLVASGDPPAALEHCVSLDPELRPLARSVNRLLCAELRGVLGDPKAATRDAEAARAALAVADDKLDEFDQPVKDAEKPWGPVYGALRAREALVGRPVTVLGLPVWVGTPGWPHTRGRIALVASVPSMDYAADTLDELERLAKADADLPLQPLALIRVGAVVEADAAAAKALRPALERVRERQRLSYPVLGLPDETYTKLFGREGKSRYLVIDRQGRIAHFNSGLFSRRASFGIAEFLARRCATAPVGEK